MEDLRIINGRLWLNSHFELANLYVSKGKIKKITTAILPAEQTIDAEGLLVMPGLIDPHTHFDLGVGANKSVDSFLSGSIAASFGGVTTYIDFLDPASNAKELTRLYKARKELAEKSVVDYRFHACLKKPTGDLEVFVKKMMKLGMYSLKIFTTYSDTGRNTPQKDIIKLLKLSKKYHFMILSHTENDDMIKIKKSYTYRDLPISRPSLAETSEALRLASYVRKYGGYLYMVHCSSGNTLAALKEQYSDILGKNFFIESCPQYLLLDNSLLAKDDGYLYTFAPPLRSEKEKELLVKNIKDINTIGTDHCPYNRSDKERHEKLIGMPLGIGGIETSFSLLYKNFGEQVINKMTHNIAVIDSLKNVGDLRVGNIANIAIFKEEKDAVVGVGHGTSDYSVYEGMPCAGHFLYTIVRGKCVIYNGGFVGGIGKMIKQKEIKL